VKGRKGRRRRQLLIDFEEKTGNWKLKEEALDRTVWRTRCGRGYGPIVGQATAWAKKVLRRPETPAEFSWSDTSEIGRLRH